MILAGQAARDCPGFRDMTFRLGINYWPISSAMYWWRSFDADEFARDAARIRGAGFDSIRIFLLWEDFQPAPDVVSSSSLRNLIKVADIAAVEGLSLIVTLFTGHMSGANWLPPWAIELSDLPSGSRFPIISGARVVQAAPKNWYTDEPTMKAQALLAREVAGTLSGHRSIWAWDLGNENSNCVVPPSRSSGIDWLKTIAGEIRSVDPTHAITIGLHMEDLEEDRNLGPAEAARVCDFLCMHGYPIYAHWANGPTDALLLPFLGLITRWLGQRDVLLEEFGAPAIAETTDKLVTGNSSFELLREPESAEYTREAIKLLSQNGFMGGMLWCFADYATALWNRPPLDRAPHERYFGLWRKDGTPKLAAKMVAELRNLPIHENSNLGWIDIDRDQFYRRPKESLTRLYRIFSEIYAPTLTS
jgi:endo-1,4-beta-mannosidase